MDDSQPAAFVIKEHFVIDASRSMAVSPTSSSSQSRISSPEPGQLLQTDDDLFGKPVPAAKATAKPKSSLKTEN